jgi:pre-mRNA-processing factor 19
MLESYQVFFFFLFFSFFLPTIGALFHGHLCATFGNANICQPTAQQLRQYVETVRQELSHALYQHDAACRVIARVTRERDQARQALASIVPASAATSSATSAATSTATSTAAAAPGASRGVAGLPESALAVIAATHQQLSKQRKKRAKSDDLAAQEAVAACVAALVPSVNTSVLLTRCLVHLFPRFTEKKAHTGLHSASKVGLCALALKGADLVLTGGNDKNAVLFDLASEAIVATLKGHTKKVGRRWAGVEARRAYFSCSFCGFGNLQVSVVALHPSEDIALTGSADGSIRVWQTPSGTLLHTLAPHHTAAITVLSLHPSGEFVLSAGDDQSWAISNVKVCVVV